MMDAQESGESSKRNAATSPTRELNNLMSADILVDESESTVKMDIAPRILESYFKPEDSQISQPDKFSKKRMVNEMTKLPDAEMRSVSPSPNASKVSAKQPKNLSSAN